MENKVLYEEWDTNGFEIPKEYRLNENSSLSEAVCTFYSAGGYEFFNVVNPQKYASNWLDFIGGLCADIVGGKYKADGKRYTNPLSEEKLALLAERGVPDIFTGNTI